MAVQITACHLCVKDVESFFNRKRIPYSSRKLNGGRTRLEVNISDPRNWQEGSLAKTCWNRLQFTYHAAQRNGNQIKCTNC
ncbi:hypothetical protein F5883DRAFT_416160 [Diaporthe sp. PMI_573]|nr:hypothetical protein F5883DRAFT_416160 [Diaporthaceae sp. PMI_573]